MKWGLARGRNVTGCDGRYLRQPALLASLTKPLGLVPSGNDQEREFDEREKMMSHSVPLRS